MTMSIQFLLFALLVCSLGVGFVSYWAGMDKGSKEAYIWKQRCEEERSRRHLAEQRHSVDYPPTVWNNIKAPDQSLE